MIAEAAQSYQNELSFKIQLMNSMHESELNSYLDMQAKLTQPVRSVASHQLLLR